MKPHTMKFTGLIVREKKGFSSLCPELDVASCGSTPLKAKRMLGEAVALYLETAFSSNLPYLRPVSPSAHPAVQSPGQIVDTFDICIDVQMVAHAA